MNHVLQVMRVQRSLHPRSIAGVIGFNVVPDRVTHGKGIAAGWRMRLCNCWQAQKKKQREAEAQVFHGSIISEAVQELRALRL